MMSSPGGAGSDLIYEENPRDNFDSGGDDTLDGGSGNDTIRAGRAPDVVRGGPGDDLIYGGSGPDTVDCGPGEDVFYSNLDSDDDRSRNCEVILDEDDMTSQPCDGAVAPAAGTTLLGTDGDDTCTGGPGRDHLEGAGATTS